MVCYVTCVHMRLRSQRQQEPCCEKKEKRGGWGGPPPHPQKKSVKKKRGVLRHTSCSLTQSMGGHRARPPRLAYSVLYIGFFRVTAPRRWGLPITSFETLVKAFQVFVLCLCSPGRTDDDVNQLLGTWPVMNCHLYCAENIYRIRV